MFFPKATGKYKHRPGSKHLRKAKAVLMRTQEGKYYNFSSLADVCRFFSTIIEPMSRLKLKAKTHGLSLAVYDPFGEDDLDFGDGLPTPFPANVIEMKYTHDVFLHNIVTKDTKYCSNVQLAASIANVSTTSVVSMCNARGAWPTNNYCFLWVQDFNQLGYRFKNFSDQEVIAFEGKKNITMPILVTPAFVSCTANEDMQIDICISKKEVMEKYKISRRTLDKLDSCKFILHDGKRFEYLK